MRKIILAASLVAATLFAGPAIGRSTPEPINFDTLPQEVTITLDNRAPCFGGRIGEGRALMTRMTAQKLASDIRKTGRKVKMVVLSPGFERTQPIDSFRTFTSIC